MGGTNKVVPKDPTADLWKHWSHFWVEGRRPNRRRADKPTQTVGESKPSHKANLPSDVYGYMLCCRCNPYPLEATNWTGLAPKASEGQSKESFRPVCRLCRAHWCYECTSCVRVLGKSHLEWIQPPPGGNERTAHFTLEIFQFFGPNGEPIPMPRNYPRVPALLPGKGPTCYFKELEVSRADIRKKAEQRKPLPLPPRPKQYGHQATAPAQSALQATVGPAPAQKPQKQNFGMGGEAYEDEDIQVCQYGQTDPNPSGAGRDGPLPATSHTAENRVPIDHESPPDADPDVNAQPLPQELQPKEGKAKKFSLFGKKEKKDGSKKDDKSTKDGDRSKDDKDKKPGDKKTETQPTSRDNKVGAKVDSKTDVDPEVNPGNVPKIDSMDPLNDSKSLKHPDLVPPPLPPHPKLDSKGGSKKDKDHNPATDLAAPPIPEHSKPGKKDKSKKDEDQKDPPEHSKPDKKDKSKQEKPKQDKRSSKPDKHANDSATAEAQALKDREATARENDKAARDRAKQEERDRKAAQAAEKKRIDAEAKAQREQAKAEKRARKNEAKAARKREAAEKRAIEGEERQAQQALDAAETGRKGEDKKADRAHRDTDKRAEKARRDAERKAEKERRDAERRIEKERRDAEKKVERERREAEKRAQRECKQAERERKDAEKQAKRERGQAEKLERLEREAEQQAPQEREEAENAAWEDSSKKQKDPKPAKPAKQKKPKKPKKPKQPKKQKKPKRSKARKGRKGKR